MLLKKPLTALLTLGRKILFAGHSKREKDIYQLPIEKKWWMGEDLFTDQRPIVADSLKNRHIRG